MPDPKKSYTTKDSSKSYMKEGESEFGLFKGESGKNPTVFGATGLSAILANAVSHYGKGMYGAVLNSSGNLPASAILGTGAVLGEGARRINAGTTNAKERKATNFSGGKTWSEAKNNVGGSIWDAINKLNIKKQELFSIQDKVPFQSPSTDINNLPSEQELIRSILGAQRSSLVKEQYNHGGTWHPPELNTSRSDQISNQTINHQITANQQIDSFTRFQDLSALSDYDFEDKYNTNKHTVRFNTDPEYRSMVEARALETSANNGTVTNYYDKFKGENPNSQWITGASNQANANPNQKQNTQDFHNMVIGTAVPVPGLEAINLGKTTLPGVIGASASASKTALPIRKGSGEVIKKPLKSNVVSPTPTSSVNINKAQKKIQEQVEVRKKYLRSEEYLNKRSANTGESHAQIKSQIDIYIKELDNTTLGAYNYGDLGKGVTADYGKITAGASSNIRVVKDQSYKEILASVDHEVGHLLSPRSRDMMASNPNTNVVWFDKKTGKSLTADEAKAFKGDLEAKTNPEWSKWESTYGPDSKIYKNYPKIDMDAGELTSYLNLPHEQQVRMVRYGEILKKNGWDGTAKGLTDDIINKANAPGFNMPDDVQQLLTNMKGIKEGTPEWYAQIKKTLPHAWALAPVAATTLEE